MYALYTYDAVWALALTLREATLKWSAQQTKDALPSTSLEDFDYDNHNMTNDFISIMDRLCFEGVSVSIIPSCTHTLSSAVLRMPK